MTDPAGKLSITMETLRDMLASCTAFQTWTGETTAAGAEDHIYLDDLDPPAGEEYTANEWANVRPFCIISMPSWGSERIATNTPRFSGTLEIDLVQTVPEAIADDPAEVALQFRNSMGQILDELLTLDLTAQTLEIVEVEQRGSVGRTHPKDTATYGDAIGVTFYLRFGERR